MVNNAEDTKKEMNYKIYIYKSFIGNILMEMDGDVLVSASFCDELADVSCEDGCVDDVINWFDVYFSEHREPQFMPNMELRGTEFQKIVWNVVSQIRYGETRTYGEIAKEVARILGKPQMSSQAVGTAVGKNPIAIIVPCHRVVPASGGTGGYAGGVERKKRLLEMEKP